MQRIILPKGLNLMKTNPIKMLHRKLICLLLIIAVIGIPSSGCSMPGIGGDRHNPQASSDFAAICSDMTTYILSQDGITCNYNVMNVENYIKGERPSTLGSYSPDAAKSEFTFLENKLSLLKEIKRSSLTEKEQLAYDALSGTLENALELGQYSMYEEPLSPVSGIQSQLPVLLAEYHFYDITYVDTYFSILRSVPDYFTQILEFEKKKLENGFFMSSEQADVIIKQCSDFIANPDDNYLIDVFDDKITQLEGITPEQAETYCDTNEDIIKNVIIPAYNNIITSLGSMKSSSFTTRGMCKMNPSGDSMDKNGLEYYSLLFRQQTNSSMNPDKAFELLEDTLSKCKSDIAKALAKDGSIYDNLEMSVREDATAQDILATLKQKINDSYPALKSDSEIKLKPVHSSLENTLSPAMYLTPPIDAAASDCIYINNASCTRSELFTTLAHEGYPGHLYQTRYFMESEPVQLRLIMNFSGYVEGWATYAELDSYGYAGMDALKTSVLKNNKLALLCIYSMIDIGIHYMGWDITDCTRLLIENGIDDSAVAKEIFLSVASEPALYPKYTISCIEFLNMEQYMRNKLGDKYDPVSFHKLILDIGPIWFEVLWKKIKGKS